MRDQGGDRVEVKLRRLGSLAEIDPPRGLDPGRVEGPALGLELGLLLLPALIGLSRDFEDAVMRSTDLDSEVRPALPVGLYDSGLHVLRHEHACAMLLG